MLFRRVWPPLLYTLYALYTHSYALHPLYPLYPLYSLHPLYPLYTLYPPNLLYTIFAFDCAYVGGHKCVYARACILYFLYPGTRGIQQLGEAHPFNLTHPFLVRYVERSEID